MSLAMLIRQGSPRQIATATSATHATDSSPKAQSVATVATVAVANAAQDDAATHYRWRIAGSVDGVYEACFVPEATRTEVSAAYPGATVEPIPEGS